MAVARYIYISSFLQIQNVIEIILENLVKHIDRLPYSIRCICKIIYILTKNQFPELTYIAKFKFVACFLFEILIGQILNRNVCLNILINEIIINETTYNKFKVIVELLANMSLGNLFSNHLSPFNFFIIEKLPTFIESFEKICEVNLPLYINQLLDGQLPKNYIFDFCEENKNQNFLYVNIFYTPNDLYYIIKSLGNKFEFIHKMAYMKLSKNEEFFKELMDEEIEKKKNNENDKTLRKKSKYRLK